MAGDAFGKNSITVKEARAIIQASVRLKAFEEADLGDALGRVTAEPVTSRVTSPPFDVSAMDGYAVRSKDVSDVGISLPLSGVSKAGLIEVPDLQPGTCMRIFTGAPVPIGADAIVIQEDAERAGETVRFLAAAKDGLHIRKAGLNFGLGDQILQAGRTLTARDIGLLAAAGYDAIPVRQRPRIAVLSTGDELAVGGTAASQNAIHDANRPGLMAAIRAWGGIPIDLGIAGDDDEAIISALSSLDADLLVISGGASVGDHDRVRPALQTLGLSFDFWKIKMRPGKPLMSGTLGTTPVLGMPGNPVSALVCSYLFLRPAIAAMTGAQDTGPDFENARLRGAIPKTGDRDDYLRAVVTFDDGVMYVEAFDQQDSSMLYLLAQSNAFLFRPAGALAAEAGETVKVLRLETVPGF
jgi:molybdopterin molybdotransferase